MHYEQFVQNITQNISLLSDLLQAENMENLENCSKNGHFAP